MKIDPRTQLPGDAQSTPVKNSRNAGPTHGSSQSSGIKPATGEDTVKISSTHSDVQTLKANLAAVPEIRVERVNALQQQVNSGQYRPDSQKIADSIIADHSHRGAKA